MGGLIHLGICIFAVISLHGTGHSILFVFAIVVAIVDFWSFGIMHNYAMDLAKGRLDRIRENMVFEERSKEDIERIDNMIVTPMPADIRRIPNWLTWINMISGVTGLLLLACGLMIRFYR